MHCPHCGANVTVRIEACPSCRFVFPADFWTDAGNEVTQFQEATTRRQIGVVLEGHYRVDEFIARGGMGEVFLGTDTKLKRRVAIKFLAAQDTPDKVVSQRFIREAQAAASLDHPNIITVHAVGEHEGRPFIVMKYVQGETVTALIRRQGRLPLPQAVHITQQVCDGLTQIHARGFVHRDVKPHNLMVENDGRCLILDFGILRDMGSEITTSGVMTGTPAYLAPEQAKDSKRADARSDLYSLGITFFEMITGQLPFRADSALDMVLKHYVEPPPPATALVPDLPPDVDPFLQRALAKNPDDRYQTAPDFRRALGLLAHPEPWHAGLQPLMPAPEATWGFESQWQGPGSAPGSFSAAAARTGPGATSIRGESVSPVRTASFRRSRAPVVALGLLLVAGAAVGAWLATREPGSAPPVRALAQAPPAVDAGSLPAAVPATKTPPHLEAAGPAPGATSAAVSDGGQAAPEKPAGIAPAGAAAAPKPKRTRRRRSAKRRSASAAGKLSWLASAAKRAAASRAATPAPTPAAPPRARVSPSRAVLTVDSQPRGAMVWAASKRLGETPIEGTLLKPGTYTLTLEKKGYASWVRSVRLRAGRTERVRATLAPKPGQLHVVTLYRNRGTWSGISVDGSKPVMTHSLKRSVQAGRHRIRVRREGYREIRREVRVGPGELRRIELVLEKE